METTTITRTGESREFSSGALLFVDPGSLGSTGSTGSFDSMETAGSEALASELSGETLVNPAAVSFETRMGCGVSQPVHLRPSQDPTVRSYPWLESKFGTLGALNEGEKQDQANPAEANWAGIPEGVGS